jgi:hypothetical protein
MILVSLNIKVYYLTFTWMTLFFGHKTVHTKHRISYKVAANSQIKTKHINTAWAARTFVES